MKIFFTSTLFGFLFLSPVFAHAERIQDFDVHIDLYEDGSFMVTEHIFYDFENAERHGIFRTIPTTHPADATLWYKERYVDIGVQSVSMDGDTVPYDITTSGKNIEIKIGDPDKTITGPHTYTIVYDVQGALFQTANTVELYWNATGNNWQVPIQNARVEIKAPRGTLGTNQACYVGTINSTEKCGAGRGGSSLALFTGRALSSGEGLTIAQELEPQSVEVVILERKVYEWFIFFGLVLVIGGSIVGLYRAARKHNRHDAIVAQYEPYEDVRPMYAGMLIDNVLHPHDITAGIVYLAEQGFLKITKINKKFLFFDTSDYEVELLRDVKHIEGAFLPQVIELVFDDHNAGSVVTLSDIKNNYSKQKRNFRILSELRKALMKDMEERGFYERYGWFGMLRRRTRKGYEAMNHLKGFKEFLSVTGKDRFKFHNAPDKNPEKFLEYLPYAIAFGVEKEWAEVFEGITIPNPEWYNGGTAGAFSAGAFTSDMSAFSSSLSSSSGASASSGGGSSGGGAGGGGGGSW